MLDEVRYGVAVLVLIAVPVAVLFWLLVHRFVSFWRRLGPSIAYPILIGAMAALGSALWTVRRPLLAVEYGAGPGLWLLAVLCYGVAFWIDLRCRRQLRLSILVGVPELSRRDGQQRLLTQGIYARVRHPRYVAILFVAIAAAAFSNYLAAWVIALAAAPGLFLVVRLEEAELERRFGAEYAAYCARVPRFVPRRGEVS